MYMWIYRSEKDCELAVEVSGWRSERRARGLLAEGSVRNERAKKKARFLMTSKNGERKRGESCSELKIACARARLADCEETRGE